MSDYASLFGETLMSKTGDVAVSSLNGKYVGVYFSAHWCGPCRQFTPKLRKVYLELKKQDAPFEIIFCSADNDINGFTEYYGSMPWLAVPFENTELKGQLNSTFAVSGIPRLVMLSPEGVINPQAKPAVEEDPAGFPWKAPTPKELIAPVIKKGEETVGSAAIDNKIFGLYFSAHWCGPCKKFTPVLASVYTQLKSEGKDFEVVFCSLDHDEEEYKAYYNEMPWCTAGYKNPAVSKVKEILEVEGIPTLVLFDSEGNVVTTDGRSSIESQGAAGYPWIPSALKDLNNEPDDINEKPSFVLFMDKNCCSEEAKDEKIKVLEELAEQFKNTVSVFYAREPGEVSNQIRGMIQAEGCPVIAIVDIPDNGGYYIAEKNEVTVENLSAFIQGYLDKSLERKQMVASSIC